jgi:hypothetical protein
MTFTGTVRSAGTDDDGCGWVDIEVELRATHETRGDRLCSTCTARIAVPVDESDNPWARAGDRWRP